MMLILLKHFTRLCFVLFLLFLSVGCAPKATVAPGPDDREVLEKRATEYWNLVSNLDAKKLEVLYYKYEVPPFREKLSLIDYLQRYKFEQYTEPQIKAVEVAGDKGKVTVSVQIRPLLPRINRKKVNLTEPEDWVKIEGTWYHVPRDFEMARQ